MMSEEEVVDLLKECDLQEDRYLFGVYALNHTYRLLIDAGEINGDQAAELTFLIINKVLSNGSGRKARRNDDDCCSLQEVEV